MIDKPGLSRRNLLLNGLGLATAAAAPLLPSAGYGRPRHVDLDRSIPDGFAGWRQDLDARPILPDEETERSVANTYDAWIARVYRRGRESVMLVLAYGNASSRTIAIHRPETCYAAQGFTVETLPSARLSLGNATVTASRLVATRRERIEPMMFWMAIAGRQSGFGLAQNIALIEAAWRDEPADGFLLRASTINPDIDASTTTIESFLVDLVGALGADMRRSLGASAR